MLCRTVFLLLCCALLLSTTVSCSNQTPLYTRSESQSKQSPKKKVVLLMVDSMLPESIDRLALENKVPALSFLIKNGTYRRDFISSFPSMSVTIESSLLTGTYADEHKVPGLLWFDQREGRMISYGDGPRATWKPGLPEQLFNSLYQLNQTHLSKRVRTIHEELHELGYTTASINSLVYRGNYNHKLVLPRFLPSHLLEPPSLNAKGPMLLGFGSASKVTQRNLPDGPLYAFGFNDAYTAQSLVALLKENRMPDLTMAYFPDMDGEIHKHGPGYLKALVRVDEQLQLILNSFGDWRRALEQYVFVVVGDNGASAIHAEEEIGDIKLERLLRGLSLYRLGGERKATDDVAVGVNGRMSYIYSLSPNASVPTLLERLKEDGRMELLVWKDGGWIHAMQGRTKLRFSYRPGNMIRDSFGQGWDVKGDGQVMGLQKLPQTGVWDTPYFPDGLRRLASVFASHEGQFLVALAAPGYEFLADGSPSHSGGGNHGGLHREDSFIPLIVAGVNGHVSLPRRMIEMKGFLLQLLQRRS